MNFKAFLTEETEKGFISNVKERTFEDLPDGDVLIKVAFSSLNYKDALSASGNKGVSRNYPHSPGIDAAGIVEQSSTSDFLKGDEVIVTGFDLGMNTSSQPITKHQPNSQQLISFILQQLLLPY